MLQVLSWAIEVQAHECIDPSDCQVPHIKRSYSELKSSRPRDAPFPSTKPQGLVSGPWVRSYETLRAKMAISVRMPAATETDPQHDLF